MEQDSGFEQLLERSNSPDEGTVLVGRILEMRVVPGTGDRISMWLTLQVSKHTG